VEWHGNEPHVATQHADTRRLGIPTVVAGTYVSTKAASAEASPHRASAAGKISSVDLYLKYTRLYNQSPCPSSVIRAR
jgi:hypothetical protein